MEKKKFIIQDLFGDRENIKYLSNESTGLEDLWYSYWPKSTSKDSEEFHPMIFEDKKTAKRYLTEIKRIERLDWSENSHIRQLYGARKPQWDIYEY